MTEYNFTLTEEDLTDVNFGTGATARRINDEIYYDIAGVLAKKNGLNVDPTTAKGSEPDLVKFANVLAAHHNAKHEGEDVLSSFDSWLKAGKDAFVWLKKKGYLR